MTANQRFDKNAQTKEAIARKKATLQAELAEIAKLQAEIATLEAKRAELVRQKAVQDAELAATEAEIAERDRQKATENREARKKQEQDAFDKMLAELDTFFEEQEQEASVPSCSDMPIQWKRMDADTEWNFEQAVRNIMMGTPEDAAGWAEKVQAAGHPMAEQLRWFLAGELDKHRGHVHPFFLALEEYSKKRYTLAVVQFEALAEQGCEDAMVALLFDALYEVNGPTDMARAFAWQNRVSKGKGGVTELFDGNFDRLLRAMRKSGYVENKNYTAEGAAAYHKGDYALAVREWEAGWRNGEDTAAYNLSVLYGSGKVPQNDELLCLWSRRFADMTTDKENLLKTARRLYRNKNSLPVLQACAYCALKLEKLGDSTMLEAFELLLQRSKQVKDYELCVEYAKELIRAGQFRGVTLLNGATRRLEAAREKQNPRENYTKYMEYVEAIEQFSGGRANKKLIATLESCANAGIGGAAFALYEIYSQGMGVREDKAQAAHWAKKLKVRDAVVFGYKGKTPIFWTVLAREDDRVLLLANDRLAEREFDPKKNGTWGDCELRQWMNSKLIKQLFTKTEQKLIATVCNKNPGSLKYDVPHGNDTMDRLFLLSAQEVERYFATYETGHPLNRTVITDPLAGMGLSNHLASKPGYGYLNSGTFSFHHEQISEWLLRTPGAKLEGYSCCVSKHQYIDSHSPAWSCNIRPALWIDLNI